MTDEDLDRIDAECAMHVMGWDLADRVGCGWGKGPPVWITHSDPNPTWQDFRPTRSWSDAGEVVEKMRPTHHVLIEGYWQGRWEVQFCVPSTEYTATAETLPLAITLAALAAVGHPWKGTT